MGSPNRFEESDFVRT